MRHASTQGFHALSDAIAEIVAGPQPRVKPNRFFMPECARQLHGYKSSLLDSASVLGVMPEMITERTVPKPTANHRIRPFEWSDSSRMHALIHEIGDRVHRSWEHDIADFEAELRLPGVSPLTNLLVAEIDGAVIGFASTLPELSIGRTVVRFGVSPGHRRRGIGTELVNAALRRSRLLGAKLAHVPAPGGDATSGLFLQQNGFVPARHFIRMACATRPTTMPAKTGFEIRTLKPSEAGALAELQNAVFDGTWGFARISEPEMTAALALSGRGHERAMVVSDGGRLIAYVWTHLLRNRSGFAGTVIATGVHPAFRRLGLGESITAEGVRSLFDAGAAEVDLEVDSKNVLAAGMYERLGFRRRGGTFWYEKRIR